MLLHLAHASENPASIRRRIRHGGAWIYLGTDARLRDRWTRGLGADLVRADLARELQEASQDLTAPFLRWTDDFAARHGTHPEWWVSRVAERNTHRSPLFLHACFVSVVRRRLRSGAPPTLIVCESAALLEALVSLARALAVGVSGPAWGPLARHRVRRLLRAAGGWTYFGIHAARARWWAARTRVRGQRKGFSANGERPLLARTFVHLADFPERGRFKDRYFDEIYRLADKDGYTTWIVPTPYGPRGRVKDYLRSVRAVAGRFVLPEDWLRASDYLSAYRAAFKLARMPAEAPPLEGMDLGPLVREERWLQAGSVRSMEAWLLSRLPPRLAEAGFAPELVLDWHENQKHDKAFILGVRRAFPNARIHGFQGVPLRPNFLNLLVTPEECRAGVAPDLLIATGALHAQRLSEASGGALRAVPGFVPRYAYLRELAERIRAAPPPTPPMVLVGLPHDLAEAAGILDTLLPVARRDSARRWVVKAHGNYSVDALKGAMREECGDAVTFGEGSLAEWLARATVFVSSADSGVPLEAAACGIPVIIVRSEFKLDYNPLRLLGESAVCECGSGEELEAALATRSRENREIREALDRLSDRILRDCTVEDTPQARSVVLHGRSPAAARDEAADPHAIRILKEG